MRNEMHEREFDVLVVGELNADLILSGDVTPQYGQAEKLIDDASLVLGSSSAIFAAGAARLGLRVAFVGKVGDDPLGRFALEELRKRGVNTDSCVVDSAIKTGLSVILLRGGDRAILTYSGSIGALRASEVNPALLARARHLHIGSFYLLDALRPDVPGLFDAAHAAGMTTSIDTNYDPTERWDSGIADVLARTDVFLPNETELTAIARRSELHEALEAVMSAPGQAERIVAVKLGARGAQARRGDAEAHAAGVPIAVVDAVGAGDSFDAGFIYGYLAGWPLERSLRLACVCGSLSTRAAGGTGAQATLAEAEEYL